MAYDETDAYADGYAAAFLELGEPFKEVMLLLKAVIEATPRPLPPTFTPLLRKLAELHELLAKQGGLH